MISNAIAPEVVRWRVKISNVSVVHQLSEKVIIARIKYFPAIDAMPIPLGLNTRFLYNRNPSVELKIWAVAAQAAVGIER